MADNVAITAGSGTSVATDQCGTDHYQKVKLTDGTADSTTMIVAGGGVEAGALRVTVASDSTGVLSVDDNGGALTVDGTVTANLSATDNAVLDSIQVAVELIDNSVDGNYLNTNMNIAGTDVVGGAGAVAAGVQRVTLASDDPGVAYLGTIAGDTTSLDTKVTACNTGAVVVASGTITTITNAVAVTNAGITSIDGKITACNTGAVVLAASDGTDIGSVDILSVTPGTAAANLGKAEDAAHTSGDVGVMALAVRFDAGGALATTDADYSPLQVDANGALRVTGGGGGTEYTEDIATANPIVGGAVMMERDDALAELTPVEGDWASLRCDANGALWTHDRVTVVGAGTEATAMRVTLATDSTGVVSVDDNGAALTVDGTVTAELSATDNAVLDSIQTAVELIDNSVDGNYLNVNMNIAGTDTVGGAGAVAAGVQRVTLASDDPGVASLATIAGDTTSLDGKVTACNTGAVVIASGTVTTITNAVAVTNAGITSIDGKITACNTGAVVVASGTITAACAGDIASDAADSGNPVKVGAKAVNMDGTTPGTAVAETDRANAICDLYGRLLVDTSHPCFWSAIHDFTEAQTAHEIKATPGAGLSLYLTDIVISNGATAGNVVLLEDTAAAANKTGTMYFAINGGAALHLKTPIKLTANKNLGITSVTCTTHSVTISGYTAP